MIDTRRVGFSDGELAELSSIMHRLRAAQAAVSAAEAARVRALADAAVLAARVSAGQPAAVAVHDMVLRGIAAEVAGCVRVSDRWAQRQIVDAGELARDYPGTVDAWEAGTISRSHVRVITELGAILPVEERGVFESIAVPVCERETPNRARGRLQRVVERLHPRSFAERHRDARESRSVRVVDLGEGMSELIATLPTLLAHAVYDRLTAQGRVIDDARTQARKTARERERAERRAGAQDATGGTGTMGGADTGTADRRTSETDEATQRTDAPDAADATYERLVPTDVLASDDRSMDQIRADVLADMLLTAAPGADPTREDDGPGVLGAIRARVQVTVPALTVLGVDDGPVELTGHAPIDPDTARKLLGTTTHPLERLLTNPVTGSVIDVDTYQRPASLDRFLRARDQHCRFPGCRLAAVRCEVDHATDWALGGRTCRGNLAHLCQRHHSMKQFTTWKVRQLSDGVLEWTSPLGHVYTDEPEPPVTFVPDDDDHPPCDHDHDGDHPLGAHDAQSATGTRPPGDNHPRPGRDADPWNTYAHDHSHARTDPRDPPPF